MVAVHHAFRGAAMAALVLTMAVSAAADDYGLADVRGTFAFHHVGFTGAIVPGCVPSKGVLTFDGEGNVTGIGATFGDALALTSPSLMLRGEQRQFTHHVPLRQVLTGTYSVTPTGELQVSVAANPPALFTMVQNRSGVSSPTTVQSTWTVLPEMFHFVLSDGGNVLRGHHEWKVTLEQYGSFGRSASEQSLVLEVEARRQEPVTWQERRGPVAVIRGR